MERLRALGVGQRIVVIVALAGVLRTVGIWWIRRTYPTGGWFSYAPLTETPYLDHAIAPMGASTAHAVVWIVLTILWALLSIWVLGLGHRRPSSDQPASEA